MRKRGMDLALMAALLAAAVACSSGGGGTAATPAKEAAPAPAAASPSAAKTATGATIESAAFSQDSDGARLVLTSDSPLLYTSYEPKPDLLVIDVPSTHTAPSFAAPSVTGTMVTSVKVETINEIGGEQTRLTILHQPGLKYDIASQGRALAIAFESPAPATAAAAGEPASAPPAPEPVVTATALPASGAPAPADTVGKPAAVAETTPPANVPSGEIANALDGVEVHAAQDGVEVVLRGDGRLKVQDFTLASPPRIVLDLAGVTARVAHRVVRGTGPVIRARVSQFRSRPERITRVVLDLDRSRAYRLEMSGERAIVHVGEPGQAQASAAVPAAAPPAKGAAPAPVSRTAIADSTSAPAAAPAPPSSSETPSTPTASVSARDLAPATTGTPREELSKKELLPGVRMARRSPRAPSAAKKPENPETKALFETAEAMLSDQQGDETRPQLSNTYKSKTMGGGETQYTGEPISLDLKDADIKDVFRTISELTGLNIVIDPDVHGTVTVRLENVPWDQALELILKQNGLGYILENNVMRIATTQKLQQEEQARAALAQARLQSLPTKTVIRKLSYANADQAAATIKKVMSPRGDVIVDARTNTLIIREIPDYMPTIMQLIENLDTPTPQVLIESRIVETTKTFGRDLGINWGFTGVADAAHGNTTNLTFPNNGSLSGTVGLESAAVNSIALRLGNILDTFNLDMALQAGEQQGLVKIVSSPKVATMSYQKAFIQTGLQIPVQTTVNNTTSVSYVNATLRLDVTPQITAEGTVMMQIQVQKIEPAPGVQIQGGGNVPLSIRQAQTTLMVKDGGTAVIGGIFQMNDQDNYNFVPGLWKIPIIGALFKNTQKLDRHDELLIFITPRIIH